MDDKVLLTVGGRAVEDHLYLSIISFTIFLASESCRIRFLDSWLRYFWISGFLDPILQISGSDPQLWLQLAPSSTMLDPSLNAGMFL